MTADPRRWMWAEACSMIERAEQMHRQFFQPGFAASPRASWEPPVDVFESDEELAILVALPGVEPGKAEVGIESGGIVVRAHRALPEAFARGSVRRLEIPQGLFERRIALPAGRYEVIEHSLRDGCLVLRIRKAGA